ncbi:MAG: primosomal protein N' [candidate division Zixibacteria bacterium]|nr:primosomal protein N' [candidate division Zixibacteria bacterium]
MRAKMANIPIILGSASPSVESFYNALSRRYKLLKLTQRPEIAELPLVRLVDLKEESAQAENLFFTHTLTSKVNQTLEKNQQVILYLNRRGFSPRIKCTDCGHTPLCPHCQLHLTYHRIGSKLMCHFCGYVNVNYNSCASCGGKNFLYIGTGTQKVEEQIAKLFPNAKIVRLDSDSAEKHSRSHIILSDFAAEKYNILLGTQMVTKGIDFPKVSLVGVLMADIGIDMPDFRASEKLFAKLIQVAGRSGRGIIPGEVIIQTFSPESDLIDDAARQDYDTFYNREIKSRRDLEYPPFSHLINFRFSGKKEEGVQKYSFLFKNRLAAGIKQGELKGNILGPAPCPLYHLRGVYRRHLFIKTNHVKRFVKYLAEWRVVEQNFGLPSQIRLIIDIDPYDMM